MNLSTSKLKPAQETEVLAFVVLLARVTPLKMMGRGRMYQGVAVHRDW